MIQVLQHDGRAADAFRQPVFEVWEEVFGPVPDAAAWREEVWHRRRSRGGFRLVTSSTSERLVGFGWGYTGQPGQFWSDFVVEQLGAAVADWVGGHFEFVELAVLPDWRGCGVGGRLHDALLAGLPHRQALLGTEDDPSSPAVRLYTSRGWRRLGKQSPTDQVMGKVLVADDHAAAPKPDRPPK